MATGVTVDDEVITVFNEFKLRREPYNYKYLIYKIEDSTKIVIEHRGAADASYEDFINHLPADDCRYGLIDFSYTTEDGRSTDKLVLVAWSPDTSKIKSKMVYAGSKESLKSVLVGVMIHITATDFSEIDHAAVLEHVRRI